MNKRVLFITLFVLVMQTFAQEKPKAIKIAEFDDRVESVPVFSRRVKQVLKELDRRPAGTRVFIAISRENRELSQSLISLADKIVAKERREKQRLVTITDLYCYYRLKIVKTEFWVVPTRAEPPYPAPLSCDYFCPTIEIQGKPLFQDKNEKLIFTVNVSGLGENEVGYKWTVEGGRLLSGQNSPSILVKIKKTARLGNGDSVIVTVRISNIPAITNCPDSVSFTSVFQPTPLFD